MTLSHDASSNNGKQSPPAKTSPNKPKTRRRVTKPGKTNPAGRGAKTDHDQKWIVTVKPLSEIRPSPQNDKLYKPVDPNDPTIKKLALSIKKLGLLEPIIITSDNYVASGHRRRVACILAGLTEVPVRVLDVPLGCPGFDKMLREYNRQRVKSLDEVAREAVIDANPEESYRRLIEHRKQTARLSSESIRIQGYGHRSLITAAKEPLLTAVLVIIDDLQDFWPLTDRRIHYALLNDPPLIHASKPDSLYQNNKASYRATLDILTRGRLAGRIPFNAIDDPTRPVVTWDVHREPSTFISKQIDQFLKSYYRDLLQSQPNHIELVGEKNTIESVIRPVAAEYCIPLTIARGYCSLPPRQAMAQRFRRSGKEKLVLLVVSDLDPEGDDIPHSLARSMRDDFGIDEERIVTQKVALRQDQVLGLGLPPNRLEAKKTSSRYRRFFAKYGGNEVYELEAVPPADLQDALRDAIDGVLDVKAFNAEVDAEKRDAAYLESLRRTVAKNIGHLKRKRRGREI